MGKKLTIVLSDSRAVASLNTPLFPVDPDKNPMLTLQSVPLFEYQIYFQETVSDIFSLVKLFKVQNIVLYCIAFKKIWNMQYIHANTAELKRNNCQVIFTCLCICRLILIMTLKPEMIRNTHFQALQNKGQFNLLALVRHGICTFLF